MDILIKVLQLLLSLSILVIFHEFGHFIAAKAFKTRVEKFYLFFNPWFAIFKFNYKGTEYGMGWLPLGGYVKISGMIDESMDKEAMKKPPQPWEFRAKPAWQRLIIMLGGVMVNVLLAVFIYVFMLTYWGEQYLPTSEVKYGITVDSLAYEMGLRNGDKILSVDGRTVEAFHKIPAEIIIEEAKTVQVLRNGKQVNIDIPSGFLNKMVHHRNPDFISFRFPFHVGEVTKGSPAAEAGIQADDQIVGINDTETLYFDEFRKEIVNYKDQEINLTIIRDGKTLTKPVAVLPAGTIGVATKNINNYFTLKEKDYTFLEAIPAGTIKTYKGVENYLKQLKLLFSSEVRAYESVGGFMTIGSIFPSTWDWQAFWGLTAFLSIMLAILNILPIPALDGGHVMFLLYEIVARRKPSDKFMEYAQIAGMVILFGLLIFANGNDIVRHFFN